MLFTRSYNQAIDYIKVTLLAFIVDLSLSDPTISNSVLFFLDPRSAFSSNFQMEGIGLTLPEAATSLHVHVRVIHISVCGSHWGHTNSNNNLTASFFLSAINAFAICCLIWKARLKTSIIFWLLVTWYLARHKILILRQADFMLMAGSLNCDVDIEVSVHCLLLHF
jgi:hypothetical protein